MCMHIDESRAPNVSIIIPEMIIQNPLPSPPLSSSALDQRFISKSKKLSRSIGESILQQALADKLNNITI